MGIRAGSVEKPNRSFNTHDIEGRNDAMVPNCGEGEEGLRGRQQKAPQGLPGCVPQVTKQQHKMSPYYDSRRRAWRGNF